MDIENQTSEHKINKHRVKVAIRVRPLVDKEIINNDYKCVHIPNDRTIILGKDKNYKFDHVFSQNVPQKELYQQCVKDLTKSCFEGYNSAIMAYGQTGSKFIFIQGGKTYTMGTTSNACKLQQQLGILPRVVYEIFSQVQRRTTKAEFLIKASFLEVYNEQILDLLNNQAKSQKQSEVSIREEKDGSISLYGINQIKVTSAQQLIYLLEKGGLHRSTSSTLMNQSSSRSHAIFTITIQQHNIQDLYKNNQKLKTQDLNEGFMTAKFVFVDLAGSQRIKKTGATGNTLKEGIKINLGLLQLGNVISALSSIQTKKNKFITYRNSKLTRILQDSLGGNSNTYMIACISPSESNYEESINTLKYASKAMNIKNNPIVNRDPHSALVSQLRQSIFELETENRRLRGQLSNLGVNVEQKSRYLEQSNGSLQELKNMKKLYLQLQKKIEEISQELKEEKKRKNEIEIKMYEIRRDRDYAWIQFEALSSGAQNVQKVIEQKATIIEEYQSKINELQALVQDKQKINHQYQQQYSKMKQNCEKDENIFHEKNKKIHHLKKQNRQLLKYIDKLHQQFKNRQAQFPQQGFEDKLHDEPKADKQYYSSDSELQNDESYNHHSECYDKISEEQITELKNVDKHILEKEAFLNEMTQKQIELEYQLINQMKQQYHQKISSLQKQKQIVLQKYREDNSSTHDKGKYTYKIQQLQSELKEYRKKVKEQKNLQKLVTNQNAQLKRLAEEIKQFKLQKAQLCRKMKQDKENFKKFKNQRIKEAMKNKRQHLKQDLKIRKLLFDNQRKAQKLNKKEEQLKRMKRINEALKTFVKPKHSRKKAPQNENQLPFKEVQFRKIVEESIKRILITLDRQIQVSRYENKIKQIQKQLQQLLTQQSTQRLKLERITLHNENQDQPFQSFIQQQTRIKLFDLKERIQNCDENLEFCKEKYEAIINEVGQKYDVDSEIVFNRAYQSVDHLRHILKYLYKTARVILQEDYKMKQKKQQLQLQIVSLNEQIDCLNEKIIMINSQHEDSLVKIRQQMMMKYYSSLQDPQPSNTLNLNNKNFPPTGNLAPARLDERERKSYEKKIVDLTKNNRQITAEVEMWRRKCTIIQDKYNSMKNLVHKDKFIGIGRSMRDQQANIIKDKKNLSLTNHKNNLSTVQDINIILDSMNHISHNKAKKNGFDEADQYQKLEEQDPNNYDQPDFTKNKWECLAKIDAHSSAVLSLAIHSNILISTANRSLKLWDIQTNKLISDLSTVHLNSSVKHVSVHHQKNIMAVACDKQISIWDLNTLNTQFILKSHKEEVKYLHHNNNYLFSAGKGSQTSGALLVWDYRYLSQNNPMEQKEKNQDIFTIVFYRLLQTSNQETLYYGTRNHQVRRMNIQNLEILSPFEPPHMDTVTGLTLQKNYLISGSKDKNLKLWSINSAINNIKCTVHASNDYINCLQSNLHPILGDTTLPIFYSGSRDGQVKVGAINKQKIQLIGGITAHTQSINSICPLTQTKQSIFATGSLDKTVRIWQPTKETLHNISLHDFQY